MSKLSPLAERLVQRAQAQVVREEGFLVPSGSPARYRLSWQPGFCLSISAIKALARRHVRLMVAKTAIEQVLVREDATVDVPMIEDAEAFERELAELHVRAVRLDGELETAGVDARGSERQ
jgi:hypothetical protein